MSMDVSVLQKRKLSSTPQNALSSSTSYIPSSKAPSATFTHQRTIPVTNFSSLEDDDVYNPRESVASIKDDPFFRNYQSPSSVLLSRELKSAKMEESLSEGEIDTRNLPSQSRSGDINIAVIGSAGVGKSTLIQRALGQRSLPTTIASSLQMSIAGQYETVSLIELDLESFDIHTDRRIQWPKQINGHIIPRMDGALLLYDVMNRESIQELPPTLNGLVNSSLPTILVACKCDNPESTRQIDVESMESACMSCVEAFKTAANVPETARLCLSAMLRAVMANRNNIIPDPMERSGSGSGSTRRRAASSAHLEAPTDPSRPLSQGKHSRSSSDYSLLRGTATPPPVSTRGQPPMSRGSGRTNLHHQITLPDPLEAPPLSSHPAFRHDSNTFNLSPSDSNHLTVGLSRTRSTLPSPSTGRPISNTFTEMSNESDAESAYRYSDDIPILQRNDDIFFEKPAKVAGVTFDELVERLLGQNMSRADSNFSDIFLCLYRKFAAPAELFSAIDARLQRIAEDRNTHYLTRTATQLRIITVMAKWVGTYPGDFASASTSARLEDFINNLSEDPVFAAAALEMRAQLQSRVYEDDDTGWGRTDADFENEQRESGDEAPLSPRRRPDISGQAFEEEMANLHMRVEEGADMVRQKSRADSTASTRPLSPTLSLSPSFHTVEDYEKEAGSMVPKGTLPLTKFRFHIFMNISDDDLADEMTRIDWVMFSAIRLRDFVRHVSLPLEAKERCKSLTNVNRMISHFNHVARWVANMILIRDKPKHRALMLEKFMAIALKLRQLNNYNGLAAVLAGINGTAIHRLSQTRALIPQEVQKRFARLVILMGTQKSHFAYRLAWENSSLPRIPFIPLHRRDLVSAEEGSRTFVGVNGERINWKKFEVLSEVILPIMKSQVVPYPNLEKHEIAREIILDCLLPADEEETYQRSLLLESSSSGAVEYGKKKLWFQK